MLEEEMKKVNDSFDNLESFIPSDLDLRKKFDDSYGCEEGVPFVLWTKNFVYFPICYDGAEWVGCVPRNPCSTEQFKPTHFGGG